MFYSCIDLIILTKFLNFNFQFLNFSRFIKELISFLLALLDIHGQS